MSDKLTLYFEIHGLAFIVLAAADIANIHPCVLQVDMVDPYGHISLLKAAGCWLTGHKRRAVLILLHLRRALDFVVTVEQQGFVVITSVPAHVHPLRIHSG